VERIGKNNKENDFTVIQDQIIKYAIGPAKFIWVTLVLSPQLAQDLVMFMFHANTSDDIKTGLYPFVIVDGMEAHWAANIEVARTYGLLSEGAISISLVDLETLKAKDTQSMPTTYFELEKNLGMFGNLLGVVLGDNYVLTTEYWHFWVMLTDAMWDN